MPCWEVRTTSVEFHAKHRKLLEQAVNALGWERVNSASNTSADVLVIRRPGDWDPFTIDLANGRATINEWQQPALNQLKQQYSLQALKRAAKLKGWQVKSKTQLKGVLRK